MLKGADDEEDSVKIWDLREGKLLKSVDGLGRNPTRVQYVVEDSFVLVTYYGCFTTIKQTGEKVYTIMNDGGVNVVAGNGKTILCVFTKSEIILYSLRTGDESKKLDYPSDDYIFCEGTVPCVAGNDDC